MKMRYPLQQIKPSGWHFTLVIVCLALLLVSGADAGEAQDDVEKTCSQLVGAALSVTERFCQDVGRNQVCYGHNLVEAEPQPALQELPFTMQGDVVDAELLRALRVSAMNIDSGQWGIALMRLQANLPDTLPGQNVTFLLFGDVEITSATVPARTVDAVANQTLTVRSGPTSGSLPLNYLEVGQGAVATGRLQDTSWLRVRVPGGGLRDGWVLASLLTPLLGNFESLEVVDPRAITPRYGPLQAIYLRTGVNVPTCGTAAPDGLLIQSPASATDVKLVINDVEVSLGSTIFIEAAAGGVLTVSTLEGLARVTYGGVTQVVAAGSAVDVPLGTTLRASAPPQPARPYDISRLAHLPLPLLTHPVVVAPALAQADIDRINEMAGRNERLCGAPGLRPCGDTTIRGLVTLVTATQLVVDGSMTIALPPDMLLSGELAPDDYIVVEAAAGDDGNLIATHLIHVPRPFTERAAPASGNGGGGSVSSGNGGGSSVSSGRPSQGQNSGNHGRRGGHRGRGRGGDDSSDSSSDDDSSS